MKKAFGSCAQWRIALLALILTAGCASRPAPTKAVESPAPRAPAPVTAPSGPSRFDVVPWDTLPGWREDNLVEAWSALLESCRALGTKDAWRAVCGDALRMRNVTSDTARRYLEDRFKAYRVVAADGTDSGLMTGYYEPLLRGSRTASTRYRFPVYGVPDDLLTIDLAEAQPALKGTALRGRLEGRRVVPYFERAGIENGSARVAGREIAWVEDPIELFFLHVQGSGRIALENGEVMRVGFADHNGHPYRSIGRVLVERGALTADQASMQGIKAWAAAHPLEVRALLDSNPRYVFFRELPGGGGGPPGALGVPLTPRRSLAVDPRALPLGAPVYVATTWPNSSRPLNQLMLAQDTGGAIQGALRGDFFWGSGESAGREAGRMRQRTRMWLLLPHEAAPPAGD